MLPYRAGVNTSLDCIKTIKEVAVGKKNENIRHLDIDDVERARRYKEFYGGCVSDALAALGVNDTVLSQEFQPLRQDMILTGSALTVKLHSLAPEIMTDEETKARQEEWERIGSPQKRMMTAVRPGSVVTYDTGRETQAAVFGSMSCYLAKACGATGILIAGNIRDTRDMLRIEDFPVFQFGTRPNAFGGWRIIEVQQPIYLPGHLRHYVQVNPGDFIFGDTDGVQIIPREFVDEVMLRCEETVRNEVEERKRFEGGMSLDDVYRIYGDL